MITYRKLTSMFASLIVILSMILSGIQPTAVSAQGGDDGRRQVDAQDGGDGVKRQVNALSGRVSFIGPESGRVLPASKALGTFARPQDPAFALASRYAPEFGVKDPARDLTVMNAARSEDGRVTVRYQQTYQGIPVMGGELIVNTNDNGDLYSINGEVSPNLSLTTQPTIDSAQAAETALQSMAETYKKTPEDFVASEPELWIFDESLLRPSTRPVELVWRMEVISAKNSLPVRELVLVDAQRGSISLHFNQIDTAWSSARNAHMLESAKSVVTTTTSTRTDLGNDDSTAQSSREFMPNLAGASWYVATTGNDSNSCSSAGSPCATINGAIDKAAAGDTVFVATGTYMEGGADEVVSIVKDIIISGGWSANFSAQNGMSVIDGNGIKRCFKIDDAATMVRVDQFIVQNGYGQGGGGIYNRGNLTLNSSSIISNTTICNNCASYWGGGIFNAGNLIVNNSTISANTAGASGGGIYNASGTLVLNNTTVSNNTGPGGGIYNNRGTVTLKNSIVANNNAGTVDCGGTVGTAGYNLIGNTTGCSFTPTTGDIINQDPLIGPLMGTQKYHPLLSGSPAIDAGNPSIPGSGGNACLGKDQRNVTRPEDIACDIGSYEYKTPGPATTLLIFNGNSQKAKPLATFSILFQVLIFDSAGSPVTGETVIFSAPPSGASGTFADTSANVTSTFTDAKGIATTSAFTANDQLGSYYVSASVIGTGSVNFGLTNVDGYYVAPFGNDANDCATASTPCATINSAIGKASEGDTVYVATGTYTGSGTEVVLIDKSLTIFGGWNSAFSSQTGFSIIDGQKTRSGLSTANDGGGDDVEIDHFIVQNGYGGVINSDTLRITNSIIRNNIGSGGIRSGGGALTLVNSTVQGNRSIYGDGGGIFAHSFPLTISNSTITENESFTRGGGIYLEGGSGPYSQTTIIENSTIVYNKSSSGGGIYIWGFYPSRDVSIKNSIISNNAAPSGIDCAGTINSSNHNIIGSTTDCLITASSGDQFNIDPLITTYPIGVMQYHALLNNSPAIDSGLNCLPTDERGVSRLQGIACDIGAYEYISSGAANSFGISYRSNQSAVPLFAFQFPLVVYVIDNSGGPVGDVNITFIAPVSGPSGTFTSTGTRTATAKTNSSGFATSPVFVANHQVGNYSVTATASGLTGSVNFNLTNAAWFVSPTGNDSNSCAISTSPCLTINAATNKASMDDTVLVASGTYMSSDSFVVTIPYDASLTVSGGWDNTFNFQNGFTVVDGENDRRGIEAKTILPNTIDRFIIKNGNGGSGDCGGITGDNLTLNNSFVINNVAGRGGGICGYDLTLNNTSVTGNIASNRGGGIWMTYLDSFLALNNSTVANNQAVFGPGGGIALDGGSSAVFGQITIRNSTIVNNSASQAGGGGIFIEDNLSGGQGRSVNISNTIIANNNAAYPDWGPNCWTGINTYISSDHNIYGDPQACVRSSSTGDLVNVDPGLGILDSTLGYYPLLLGSPAIDAGNPITCLDMDQLGIPRPQGIQCDIGAIELYLDHSESLLLKTYDAENTSNLASRFVCDQTDLDCTSGDAHEKAAHRYAAGTYNLYKNVHRRNSIDGLGTEIISSVHFCSKDIYGNIVCPYDNAFWNGYMMIYGDAHGWPLADDIVAHELTHGVTQHESNLFYYYQSGAINESFSDLWGEYYDQSNGLDVIAGYKWRIGEDIGGWTNPAPYPTLGIRDMSNPTLFHDPDKISSTYYYEGGADSGGVHWNSGVNNKAVYLMVEGGSFNGKMVTALGWEKTGAIYYEAQTSLLTSGADYSDLYFAIQQACSNLIDKNGITAENCVEVKDAVDAVEMNGQPAPNFNTDALLCSTAGMKPNYVLSDDLESGIANWTFNNGTYTRWQIDSPYYGTFAHSGLHSLYADDYPGTVTDARAQLVPVTIPSNGYLHFAHAYEFETGTLQGSSTLYNFDGGVIEFSTNSGSTWTDAGALIDTNAYKGKIFSGFSNPLANRSGFVGISHGYISTRLNLASLAGQTVIFRWRMGLDEAADAGGWWVDDVKVYNCVSNFTISGNVSVPGATLSYVDGTAKSVTSKPDGSYSFQVSPGWSGTVTPTHPCFTFDPASRTYSSISTNQPNQDYSTISIPSMVCVLSITRAGPDPTNASNVDFTVTFSKPVTGVDTTAPFPDFVLTTSLTGASITNVSGSGAIYTVTVNTGSGNGTVRLDVMDDNTIMDAASNPLGGVAAGDGNYTSGEAYTILKTPTFGDVPLTHPYFGDIEILYANGYTGGCSTSPMLFCPNVSMSRAQSAVFMLRGNFGSAYVPVTPTHFFKDNWKNSQWGEGWAESMYLEGLTGGCSSSPLKFCPDVILSNVQLAVFGLRLKYGMTYSPPAATGTVFADMTDVNFWGTGWAEQAYADGLIPACGTSGGKPLFCPDGLVSRGFGASVIVRAKNLVMP